MEYEIKIFSELNSSLKKDWQDLELNSHNYCFQCYDWFENWVNNYRINNKNCSLRTAVIKHETRVICIFPFEIEKKFKLKILKWAGNKLTDYCSPVLSKDFNLDKKSFIHLFKRVINDIKNIDIIYLIKQPEYIHELKNPFTLFLNNYEDSKTYYILLPQRWNIYKNQILKKEFHLQNVRKKKSLKKLGNLKFKIANNISEKTRLLNELFLQKNIRLGTKNIKDILESKDFQFYNEFEKKNLYNIKTHLSSLELNDELIAVHWGIIYKKRFYYLLLSMKEGKLSRYSPGRLLISLLIRWAISKKFEIFDFTLGEEDYKKSWSNKNSSLHNYIGLNSINGFIFFLLIKLKLFLKTVDKKKYFRKLASKFF